MNNYLLLAACFWQPASGSLLPSWNPLAPFGALAGQRSGVVERVRRSYFASGADPDLRAWPETRYDPDRARVDGLGHVRDRMRFLLAGRTAAWFFTGDNRRANADRRASEHVVSWPADDRNVLWPAVSWPRDIDRPVRIIFCALNPRHHGGLAVFLRWQHQCEEGGPKDRAESDQPVS